MRDLSVAYEFLVGKSEKKKPSGRHGCRWEDNIGMDITEIG
jgi:hypothetical protein